MKPVSIALPLIALNAVSATCIAPDPGSNCNVEGNIFQLEAFQAYKGYNRVGLIYVTQIGDLGTDTLAHFSDYKGPVTQTAVFYINKANNRLILLDPFSYMNAANSYTDRPDGGEMKFTFFNDTRRPDGYNWPVYGISEDGWLTVGGKSDVFSHCPPTANATVLTGSIAIGVTGDASCKPLDGLKVYPLTSQLSVE